MTIANTTAKSTNWAANFTTAARLSATAAPIPKSRATPSDVLRASVCVSCSPSSPSLLVVHGNLNEQTKEFSTSLQSLG